MKSMIHLRTMTYYNGKPAYHDPRSTSTIINWQESSWESLKAHLTDDWQTTMELVGKTGHTRGRISECLVQARVQKLVDFCYRPTGKSGKLIPLYRRFQHE